MTIAYDSQCNSHSGRIHIYRNPCTMFFHFKSYNSFSKLVLYIYLFYFCLLIFIDWPQWLNVLYHERRKFRSGNMKVILDKHSIYLWNYCEIWNFHQSILYRKNNNLENRVYFYILFNMIHCISWNLTKLKSPHLRETFQCALLWISSLFTWIGLTCLSKFIFCGFENKIWKAGRIKQ